MGTGELKRRKAAEEEEVEKSKAKPVAILTGVWAVLHWFTFKEKKFKTPELKLIEINQSIERLLIGWSQNEECWKNKFDREPDDGTGDVWLYESL